MGDNQRIIWNITRLCYWDCYFCVVDAYQASSTGEEVRISANKFERIVKKRDKDNKGMFTTAQKALIEQGRELTLEQKLKILDNIDIAASIDISGGDALTLDENIHVLAEIKKKFGRENTILTITGPSLARLDPRSIGNLIGVVGFTYDNPFPDQDTRPAGYNVSNLKQVQRLQPYSVKTSAQVTLHKDNLTPAAIRGIFFNLRDANIDEIHLMRTLQVGRGSETLTEIPSDEEYMEAVMLYQDLEREYGSPRLAIQTALKHPDSSHREFHARHGLSSSLAITNMGILTLSPWAYDAHGEPLPDFIVGDVKEYKVSDIYRPGMKNELVERLKLKDEK